MKTKEEKKEYNRQYHEKNKEKTLKKQREWYQKNKENVADRKKQYHQTNKSTILEKKKEYAENNKEAIAEYQKEYREEHKENRLAYERQYYKINPEKIINKWRKRRTQKKSLPCTLTNEQWESCKQYFDNTCAYCGKKRKLCREHFIALSKGGGYTRDNIIPSCRSCNSRKSASDFSDWYSKQEFYDKERELKILKYLEGGETEWEEEVI